MKDDVIGKKLRELPEPELPAAWRTEIILTALRSARSSATSRRNWPPLLVMLRNLFARNPITASALTALWMLIFLFKANTPVDPAEKEMLAHYDPNRPIYLVSIRDEIELAELWQNPPDQQKRIP